MRPCGSLCVFLGPFLGGGFELGAVALVELGDLGDEGVIGVGIGEEGGDGEEDLGDGECGRPLVLEDVEADGAVGVDVGVVDLGDEVALGRPEGVVGGEVDVEEEDSAGVGAVLGADDGRLPVELVVLCWSGRAIGRWVLLQISKFLLDSLLSHLIYKPTLTMPSYKAINSDVIPQKSSDGRPTLFYNNTDRKEGGRKHWTWL